jgi:putative transposase
MARQARIEYPGALYHVISRGIERHELFRDDEDRERYLGLLEKAVGRYRCRIFAYCLMGNHVHLAVEAGAIPLSRVMRSMNTAYAGYFNKRHRRAGYLFQGRYKAYLVEKEEYLLSLIRYIHENPVGAGIARTAKNYRWSSHLAYLERSPQWLSADEVLHRFGRSRARARAEFEAFFLRDEARPYEKARRYVQTVVGDEGFAEGVLKSIPDDPVAIRRLEAARLVEWIAREEKLSLDDLRGLSRRRDLAHVRALCGYLGREVVRMPLSKIARELGRSPSTLWRDVAGLESALAKDKALRKKVTGQMERLARFANNT